MATKASFSPDEWTKVLQSVVLAGVAVSAAEPPPSGRYCFGTGPGARAPLPAAKIKAAVFKGDPRHPACDGFQ